MWTLNSEFCILNSQCLNLNERKFDTDKDENEKATMRTLFRHLLISIHLYLGSGWMEMSIACRNSKFPQEMPPSREQAGVERLFSTATAVRRRFRNRPTSVILRLRRSSKKEMDIDADQRATETAWTTGGRPGATRMDRTPTRRWLRLVGSGAHEARPHTAFLRIRG